jgi:FKBP-type peptidyl-prolyl cis-trans isomerase FkpA
MKHFLRPTLTAAALAVALGITAGAQAQTSSAAAAPVANKAQASQILGYQMVGSIPGVIRQNVDPAVVGQAVTAALSGQKPNMSDAQAQATWKEFMTEMQAKAKAEFDAESAKNKAEGDCVPRQEQDGFGREGDASGLQYQVLTPGSGARPGPNDTVKINYTGTFVDGRVFDSSQQNGGAGFDSVGWRHSWLPRRSAADAGWRPLQAVHSGEPCLRFGAVALPGCRRMQR